MENNKKFRIRDEVWAILLFLISLILFFIDKKEPKFLGKLLFGLIGKTLILLPYILILMAILIFAKKIRFYQKKNWILIAVLCFLFSCMFSIKEVASLEDLKLWKNFWTNGNLGGGLFASILSYFFIKIIGKSLFCLLCIIGIAFCLYLFLSKYLKSFLAAQSEKKQQEEEELEEKARQERHRQREIEREKEREEFFNLPNEKSREILKESNLKQKKQDILDLTISENFEPKIIVPIEAVDSEEIRSGKKGLPEKINQVKSPLDEIIIKEIKKEPEEVKKEEPILSEKEVPKEKKELEYKPYKIPEFSNTQQIIKVKENKPTKNKQQEILDYLSDDSIFQKKLNKEEENS